MDKHEEEVRKLQEKVAILEKKVSIRETEAYLVIDGEDTVEVVLRTATALGVNVEARDLLFARRLGFSSTTLGNARPRRPRQILVSTTSTVQNQRFVNVSRAALKEQFPLLISTIN